MKNGAVGMAWGGRGSMWLLNLRAGETVSLRQTEVSQGHLDGSATPF